MKKKHTHQTNYLLIAGVAALVSSSVIALGSLSQAQVTAEQRASCEASCKADTSADMPPPEQRDCAMWCEDGDYKGPAPSSGGGSTTSSCDWSQWNDPECATAVCNTETKKISCTERRQSGGSGGGAQGQGCPVPSSYDPSQCMSYCTATMGESQATCQWACDDGCPCGPAESCPRGASGGQRSQPPQPAPSPYDACRSRGYVIDYVASDSEQQACRDESARRGQGDSFCICIDGNPDGAGQQSGGSQYQGGMGCGPSPDRPTGYGYHWACQNGAWAREADGQQGSGQQNFQYGAPLPPTTTPQEGPVEWPEEGIDVCGAVQANGGHPVCFKGTAWNGNARVCAKMGLPMVGHECVQQKPSSYPPFSRPVPPIYQIDRPDHRGGPSQYHGGPNMGRGMMGGHMDCERLEEMLAKMQAKLATLDKKFAQMTAKAKKSAYRKVEKLEAQREDALVDAETPEEEAKIQAMYDMKITKARKVADKRYPQMLQALEERKEEAMERMQEGLTSMQEELDRCQEREDESDDFGF